jgi:hypothetical protein
VHNLADTKYASMVYVMPNMATNTLESSYFIDNNMGRSVNLSVQYRF